MNEVANLCERVGADVDQVRRGIGTDSRIGKRFLFPGLGYGGSCFPKDVQALYHTAAQNEYDFSILDAVMKVNYAQRKEFFSKVLSKYKGDLNGKVVGLWGLAFKPNTDDVREAPAVYLIEELLKYGAKIRAYDPEAMAHVKAQFGDKVYFANDQYDAIESVDMLIIATEWNTFRSPDFDKVIALMKHKVIFDGRNLYQLNHMKDLGFYYYSVGRKTIE